MGCRVIGRIGHLRLCYRISRSTNSAVPEDPSIQVRGKSGEEAVVSLCE